MNRSIKKYNPTRKAFISHDFLEKYRYNLDLYSQKLLFGLAQSLDVTEELFPTWNIDIRHLFKYLNIENTNKRYEIVRKAFMDILKNPVEWKMSERRWGGLPWLSFVQFNEEDNNMVTMQFNDSVKSFLLDLKQYCELETRYYVGLSSKYSIWLYPHLRNAVRMGTLDMTIQKIKEITFTDEIDSYDSTKKTDGTRNFLKNVLGIQRNVQTNTWEIVTRKSKKTDKEEAVGTINEINTLTDLKVTVEVLKSNRVYDKVRFKIEFKNKKEKTAEQKETPIKEIGAGKIPGKKWATFPVKEAFKYALAAKMPFHEYIEKSGYKVSSRNKQMLVKLIDDKSN
jgi:hypothetical protein